MSKYVSIDFFDGTVTSGIVEMRSALDIYPMPISEGVAMPTPHVWQDGSILLRPGLTMEEVERYIMNSFELIFERYGPLCARVTNDNCELYPKLKELALRARGII